MPPKGSRRPDGAAGKGKSQQANKCAVWDFRYHCSAVASGDDDFEFFKLLTPHFKSATWSLERCPTSGNLHYQGRGSLHKKLRPGQSAIDLSKEIADSGYFVPTADPAGESNTGYMTKAASHVRGPWTLKEPPREKTTDVQYIEDTGMPPYGKVFEEMFDGPVHPREIWWVADRKGNSKKSAVLQTLYYKEKAMSLPMVGNCKDFLQFAYGYKRHKSYIINIQRALSWATPQERKEFAGFIAGVESLKDGYVYDTRNTARQAFFSRPHVLVFANQLPMFDDASLDRWRIFDISEGELVEQTDQVLEEHRLRKASFRLQREQDKVVQETVRNEKYQKFVQGHQEEWSVASRLDSAYREYLDKCDAIRKLPKRSRSPRRPSEASTAPTEAPVGYVFESDPDDLVAPMGDSETAV